MKDLSQPQIRRAVEQDLPRIAAIQAASPSAAHWDPASYLRNETWVAVSDSGVVGFLAVRQTAPGENEILNLAVHPLVRRKGIAYRLVNHALGSRSGDWFLEVRASNAAAIRLYEALGFAVAGRREDYYESPPEPAIVMRFLS